MNLSETDRARIARLREREHLWKRNRWLVLASGVLEVGVAIYVFFWAKGHAVEWGGKLEEYTPVFMFMLAVLGTKIEALFLLGVLTLVYVWRRWDGDPERVLLLSIVDSFAPVGNGNSRAGGG